MSVQAMSHIIDHSKQKGSSFVVLLMIANHAHSDGTNAFPSFDTLALEARISYRQVTRIVPRLVASGELIIDKKGGPHASNRYRVSMEKPAFVGTKCQGKTRQSVGTFATEKCHKCPPNHKEPNTEPKYRAQPRSAKLHIDEQIEYYRRQTAKAKRLDQEHELKEQLYVCAGPEILATAPNCRGLGPQGLDLMRRIGEVAQSKAFPRAIPLEEIEAKGAGR